MSALDKFRKSWESRFPFEVVPTDLDFLKRSTDMQTLESSLDLCVQRTDDLNIELAKQKFISEFILQLMDSAADDGPNNMSMGGSTSSPIHHRSSSFEMLDADIEDQRINSLDSSLATNKPPILRGLLGAIKNTNMARTISEPNITESQPTSRPARQNAVGRNSARQHADNLLTGDLIVGRSSFLNPHSYSMRCSQTMEESGQPTLTDCRRSGAMKKISNPIGTNDSDESAAASTPAVDYDDLTNDGNPPDGTDEPDPPALPGRRRLPRQDLYEEAIPFTRTGEDGERVMSDEDRDEEEKGPIYYNILLMKETLDRTKQRCFNDDQPNKLAHQARKLSMRYNRQPLTVAGQNKSDGGTSDDAVVYRRKRQSMLNALGEGMDANSDIDELDALLTPCRAEDEKLQMRKSVVTSILDSEQDYVDILEMLVRYMVSLKNAIEAAPTIVSLADLDTMFLKIPDLHKIHSLFIQSLKPKVEKWSNQQEVAEIFHKLAEEEYAIAPIYLKNYQTAISTVQKCYQENPQFLILMKDLHLKGNDNVGSLEELLHKPVVRIQRNTLVLHDLINCTPSGHPDYDLLQKTLKAAQKFLSDFETLQDKTSVSDNHRYLVKHDVVVERFGNTRKLRNIFLFNDIFVCARQKLSSKQRLTFETDWFIPLIDVSVSEGSTLPDEGKKQEIEKMIEPLRRKVVNLQNDLKVEMKRAKLSNELQRQWSFRAHTKNVEKIKKKLLEQKAALILESPSLVLNVTNERYKRTYTLLLTSDYERTSWITTVEGLQRKRVLAVNNISATELNNTLNQTKLPRMSLMGSLLVQDELYLEEEYLFGSLTITIRNLEGLVQEQDTYCSVEVDSFGHFFVQATTSVISKSVEPKWDEDFDIDLEGAQTLRVLCYKKDKRHSHLIGKFAYELNGSYLKREGQEENIQLNDEMSLSLFLMYRSRDQTLKRTLSSAKEGLFGVRIRAVTRRENNIKIPLIITSCVEEIESRGMRDLGIYRVSGLSSELQKLKKAFEKNSRTSICLLKTTDINVVTGLLKMYLRELPEALFTDALYPEFVKGMGFSDPEAKEKYMLNFVRKLPEPNYATAIYILDHLIKVSQHKDENKMNLQNLATVFGPTLLRPAIKEGENKSSVAEMFSAGAREAMTQVAILLHLLNLRTKSAFGSHV